MPQQLWQHRVMTSEAGPAATGFAAVVLPQSNASRSAEATLSRPPPSRNVVVGACQNVSRAEGVVGMLPGPVNADPPAR